ncbi:hypothetical protein JOC95_001186 [Bacillus tianshenii]|uniref:Uncharacterized protein n=1 Tax=Sutcliffiella tianshenii TaxID=1463404 RepID=A0ABS2NY09_9BACI|nr:hypothetical protein [Bacillus tianshenii]
MEINVVLLITILFPVFLGACYLSERLDMQ